MEARHLGDRFSAALAYTAELHRTQPRKGTDTPYLAHLLAVTSIVLEHGGDEEQAIAALLHDAVEDQGGDAVREQILERFGERVLRLVNDCTDADEVPKPPWKERKEQYVAHIATADIDAVLISMADKLHNASAIVRDHRRVGPEVFTRFKAPPNEVAWYYGALLQAYEDREPAGQARELFEELRLAVGELQEVAVSCS